MKPHAYHHVVYPNKNNNEVVKDNHINPETIDSQKPQTVSKSASDGLKQQSIATTENNPNGDQLSQQRYNNQNQPRGGGYRGYNRGGYRGSPRGNYNGGGQGQFSNRPMQGQTPEN